MQKVKIPLLLVTFSAMMLVSLHAIAYSETLLAQYQDGGITYYSYSKEWSSEAKLKALHQELLNNVYGEEMKSLTKITLYPDYRDRAQNESGSYSLSYRLSPQGEYEILPECAITLYGANTLNTVEKISHSLAKQYGKHFTQYYLLKKENIVLSKDGLSSQYAQIRSLHQLVRNPDHQDALWNLSEIAANDYVQLFGSTLARKHYPFVNMIDQIEKNPNNWVQPFTAKYMYNLMPQENLTIPLANEVKGLRSYWLTLANIPDQQKNLQQITKPQLYIDKIQQLTSKSDSVQITFAWNVELQPGQTLNYTLATYGEFDSYPYPVITYENITNEGQILTGRYGTVVSRANNMIHYNKHIGFYGKKTFRVFVSDNRGNLISSNALEVDLSQSPVQIINNQLSYRDIVQSHWAYESLAVIGGYGIISGYPDNTFRPNQSMSRAEMLTILLRVNDFNPYPSYQIPLHTSYVQGNHWAVPILNDAIRKNIVKKDYYGNQYQNFRFDETITREEAAMLCAQILKSRSFNGQIKNRDANAADIQSSIYADDIRYILRYDIMGGFPDGTFKPKDVLTRAEAASIANRMLGLIRTY